MRELIMKKTNIEKVVKILIKKGFIKSKQYDDYIHEANIILFYEPNVTDKGLYFKLLRIARPHRYGVLNAPRSFMKNINQYSIEQAAEEGVQFSTEKRKGNSWEHVAKAAKEAGVSLEELEDFCLLKSQELQDKYSISKTTVTKRKRIIESALQKEVSYE